MELEKQVVSLELAKKLKELGVKQESLFYWTNDSLRGWELRRDGESFENSPWSPCFEDGDLSAFTVAELGEILPKVVEDSSLEYELTQQYDNEDGWSVYYEDNNDGTKLFEDRIFIGSQRTSEADARASFLIHLLENNLITL